MANYIEGESNDGRVNLVAKAKGTPHDPVTRYDENGSLTGPVRIGFDDDVTMAFGLELSVADIPPTNVMPLPDRIQLYRVDVMLHPGAGDPTAGVLTLDLEWNGPLASFSDTSLSVDLSIAPAAANVVTLSRVIQIDKVSGAGLFTYATVNSGSYGTAGAFLNIRVTPLG